MLEFRSTKTYTHAHGYSCCFRQHRADSHCRFLHGYALQIKLTFGTEQLDKNGWVVDFGGLKEFKAWLDAHFDHKTLVATDDPMLPLFRAMNSNSRGAPGSTKIIDLIEVDAVGVEAFASFIFQAAGSFIDKYNLERETRAFVHSVEVSEHPGNSAILRRKNG